MICKHCGAQNREGAFFCYMCGRDFGEESASAMESTSGTELPASSAESPSPAVQQPTSPVYPAVSEQKATDIQSAAKPVKNIGALVCAVIGGVFGMGSGLLWTLGFINALVEVSGYGFYVSSVSFGVLLFALLGVGGGVVTIIGGTQAFRYKRRRSSIALSFTGFACQLVCPIMTLVVYGGFPVGALVLGLGTLLSLPVCLASACLSLKKPM